MRMRPNLALAVVVALLSLSGCDKGLTYVEYEDQTELYQFQLPRLHPILVDMDNNEEEYFTVEIQRSKVAERKSLKLTLNKARALEIRNQYGEVVSIIESEISTVMSPPTEVIFEAGQRVVQVKVKYDFAQLKINGYYDGFLSLDEPQAEGYPDLHHNAKCQILPSIKIRYKEYGTFSLNSKAIKKSEAFLNVDRFFVGKVFRSEQFEYLRFDGHVDTIENEEAPIFVLEVDVSNKDLVTFKKTPINLERAGHPGFYNMRQVEIGEGGLQFIEHKYITGTDVDTLRTSIAYDYPTGKNLQMDLHARIVITKKAQ